MFKTRRSTDLQKLIREYKLKKPTLARAMGLSTHQVARILKKDIKDLTINQLEQIISCTGYTMSIYLDERIV